MNAKTNEDEDEVWNPDGIKIKNDDMGFCNVCNSWQTICNFLENDKIKQPCKSCYVCDDEDEDGEYMNELIECNEEMNAEIKFKTNERNINCCRENEADKLVRNIEQVYICQGCNCDINDNGFCSEGCIFDDEVQPHCQVCFNMNSNLFVTKNALNPICRGKCVKKLIEKQSGLQTEIEENKLKINNLIAEHKQKDVEIDNLLEKYKSK